MGSSIIEVQGLEKYFMVTRPLYKQFLAPFCGREKVRALRDVSFNVNAGEIIGIVGPNGAGKTTLLRILADLLKADVGQVIFCGQQLNRYGCRLRSKIGYVSSDERSFFWRLTGRQNLYFFSHLYGLARTQARRRISSMLDVFSLNDKADQLFRDYSTGTRKKFALIRGLMHQPSILLLDELTNSLDPVSSQSVKSLVRGYVQEQQDCAVIWSTHRLEEVGQICDKVLIIDNGLMKFFGAVSELQDRTEPKEVFFAKIKAQNETNPV